MVMNRKIRLATNRRPTRPVYREPKEEPWKHRPPVDGFSFPLQAKTGEVPFWDGTTFGWHVFVWDHHARRDRNGNWVRDEACYSYREDRAIPYTEWTEMNELRNQINLLNQQRQQAKRYA